MLADHGQASCVPYRTLTGGRRFEEAFFDQVPGYLARPDRERGPSPGRPDPAELGFEPYLDVAESRERDGIRVVSAGPNAFVYFVDIPEPLPLEAIEARCPSLVVSLSKSAGVGLVLARSAAGPLCVWRGESYRLPDAVRGPFAGRPDAAIVTRDLAALMAMPSAGDLVVYGPDAPEGHVSYIDEVGAHAGPSSEELHTFVVAPVDVALPTEINHPIDLYRALIRYQSSAETSLDDALPHGARPGAV